VSTKPAAVAGGDVGDDVLVDVRIGGEGLGDLDEELLEAGR
jgi:hypothetical protein